MHCGGRLVPLSRTRRRRRNAAISRNSRSRTARSTSATSRRGRPRSSSPRRFGPPPGAPIPLTRPCPLSAGCGRPSPRRGFGHQGRSCGSPPRAGTASSSASATDLGRAAQLFAARPTALEGYAVATTDTGHTGSGLTAEWAVGHSRKAGRFRPPRRAPDDRSPQGRGQQVLWQGSRRCRSGTPARPAGARG